MLSLFQEFVHFNLCYYNWKNRWILVHKVIDKMQIERLVLLSSIYCINRWCKRVTRDSHAQEEDFDEASTSRFRFHFMMFAVNIGRICSLLFFSVWRNKYWHETFIRWWDIWTKSVDFGHFCCCFNESWIRWTTDAVHESCAIKILK